MCYFFLKDDQLSPLAYSTDFHMLSTLKLFAGLHLDLECNEQNHMKMSQQSHSIYFTSFSEMVLTENIFQKLSIIVTQIILDMLEDFCDIQHCWSGRVIQLCHVHITVM